MSRDNRSGGVSNHHHHPLFVVSASASASASASVSALNANSISAEPTTSTGTCPGTSSNNNTTSYSSPKPHSNGLHCGIANFEVLRGYRDELFSHPSPTLADGFETDHSEQRYYEMRGYNYNTSTNTNNNYDNNDSNYSNDNNNHNNNSSFYEDDPPSYASSNDNSSNDNDDVCAISRLLARQLTTLREIRSQQELKDELIYTLKERILVLEQDQCYSDNIISGLKQEVFSLTGGLESKELSERLAVEEKLSLISQIQKLQSSMLSMSEELSVEKEKNAQIARERDAANVELLRCKEQLAKQVEELKYEDASTKTGSNRGKVQVNNNSNEIVKVSISSDELLISSIISDLDSDFKLIRSQREEECGDHVLVDMERIQLQSSVLLICNKLETWLKKLSEDPSAPDCLLSFIASLKHFMRLILGEHSYINDLRIRLQASDESLSKNIQLNERFAQKILSTRPLTSFVKKVIPKHIQAMLSCGIINRDGNSGVVFDLNAADISGVFSGNKSTNTADFLHSFQVFENGVGILLERYQRAVTDSSEGIFKLKASYSNRIAAIESIHDNQIMKLASEHKAALEALTLKSASNLEIITSNSELELKEQVKRIKGEYNSKLLGKLNDIEGLVNDQKSKHDSIVSNLSNCLHSLMKYTIAIQDRYQELSIEKSITARACRGLSLLRDDIDSLSLACVKTEVHDTKDAKLRSHPHPTHQQQQQLYSNGAFDFNFKATEYPIKRASRRLYVPTLRIVALAIIAGNRFILRGNFRRNLPLESRSSIIISNIPDISLRVVKDVSEWKLPLIEEDGDKVSNNKFFPTLLSKLTCQFQGNCSVMLPGSVTGMIHPRRSTRGRTPVISANITTSAVVRSRESEGKGGRRGGGSSDINAVAAASASASIYAPTSKRLLWSVYDPHCLDIYGKLAFTKVQDTLLCVSRNNSKYAKDASEREKRVAAQVSSMKARIETLEAKVSQQLQTIEKQSEDLEKCEKLQICSTEYVIKLMKDTVVIGNPANKNDDMRHHQQQLLGINNKKEKEKENTNNDVFRSNGSENKRSSIVAPSWILVNDTNDSKNISTNSSYDSRSNVSSKYRGGKDASLSLTSYVTSSITPSTTSTAVAVSAVAVSAAVGGGGGGGGDYKVSAENGELSAGIMIDEASRIDGSASDDGSYDDNSLNIIETYSQVTKLTDSLRKTLND